VPLQDAPALIPDSKVGQFRALLRQSGVLEIINAKLADRPGPPGVSIEAVLTGLMLSCVYRRGSTNLDDTAEVLGSQISKAARNSLGLRDLVYSLTDACVSRAAYARIQRAFDALTTSFDPARHDRRRRLTREETATVRQRWEADSSAVDEITKLADLIIHVSIAKAEQLGALRHWRGDIGIDGTPAPTWGLERRSSGMVLDPHADWYKKGGSEDDDLIWANGLALAFTGHASSDAAGKYPQLALGMCLHTPNIGEDTAVISILKRLDARFRFRRGYLALDRGYADRLIWFYEAIRATGRDLVIDYKKDHLGRQKTTPAGAQWFGGVPVCPNTPAHLLDAAHLLAKGATREDKARGQALMDQALDFQFQTKEHPKEPGASHRIQCPAAGPSPTVTCPWAEERARRAGRAPDEPPPVTLDLTNLRKLRSAAAGKPRVQPPDIPFDARPLCCQRDTTTVPPDSNPKFRQRHLHGSTPWKTRYSAIRSHNEGGNGALKGIDTDIGERKNRLPRGRVAQTLLIAIQITIANLRQIALWKRDNKPDAPQPAALPDVLADDSSEPRADETAPEPRERPPRD
jgi:hypothetical protein